MLNVKICGIRTADAARTAAGAGAAMLGFVFFPPSPRHLSLAAARALAPALPAGPERVGVFVNADDKLLHDAVTALKLDVIQLHGQESPARAKAIREMLGVKIIRAVGVRGGDDFDGLEAYLPHVDAFLFDAKPPIGARLPGGNARSFPWGLMQHFRLDIPWMLAGGLTANNLADAVALSGASAVDISSGVEKTPGNKDAALIEAFLDAAKML